MAATKAALRRLPGVSDAGAQLDDERAKEGSAWAVYDPANVTPEQMMAAIQKLGYKPTLLEG